MFDMEDSWERIAKDLFKMIYWGTYSWGFGVLIVKNSNAGNMLIDIMKRMKMMGTDESFLSDIKSEYDSLMNKGNEDDMVY